MEWLTLISYFFGGLFLCNAIPHVVSGLMGRAFQSPFAKPPGQGLSSSTLNVVWGMLNLAVAYILICRVGDFSLRSTAHVATLGLGFLLIGLYLARHFGGFHGGNSPGEANGVNR
jgi:cobalamin synthase